jgi:RHS repeat-associated protein
VLYYGFRYYDPETGRWPNRDPIGELAFFRAYTENKEENIKHKLSRAALFPTYLFVHNNPITRNDPYGLDAWDYLGESFTWFWNVGNEALQIEDEEYGEYVDPFGGDYRHCLAGCIAVRSYGTVAATCMLVAWDLNEDNADDSAAGWAGLRGANRYSFTSCRVLCKDRTTRPVGPLKM